MLLLDELRDAWRAEDAAHRVALLAIVAIAIVLRAIHLSQPMRYDESVTYVYFAQLPLEQALSTYTYPNNHLFHTLLVKGAIAVFGDEPWAIRLPAFLAGVLLVPATYALARALYDSRAALFSAALTASSGVLTLYSTNARGYSLIALAFVLLALAAIRIQRGSTPAAAYVTFAVVAALGLWTIPVMLFPLGAVALWLALWALLDNRRDELRRLGAALVIAGALAALAYAPVFANEGVDSVVRNRFVAPQGWVAFFAQLSVTWRETLRSWGLGIPLVVSVALLGCVFSAFAEHARISRFRINIWVAVFAWSAWLLVVTHRAPFARVWLWILPLASALAGAGIVEVLRRWKRGATRLDRRAPMLAALASLALALLVTKSNGVRASRDTGVYQDAELAARTLQRIIGSGDRVLAAIPTNGPLAYYLESAGVVRSILSRPEQGARRIFAVVDVLEGQTLASVIAGSAASDSRLFERRGAALRLPGSAIVTFERRDAAPE